MKVNLFNHWFKHKVPIDDHFDSIVSRLLLVKHEYNLWHWLDDNYDVGQYYNVRECRNYMVFHNKNHYLTFLLKL